MIHLYANNRLDEAKVPDAWGPNGQRRSRDTDMYATSKGVVPKPASDLWGIRAKPLSPPSQELSNANHNHINYSTLQRIFLLIAEYLWHPCMILFPEQTRVLFDTD